MRIDDESFAFFDHGIELTRRFRALKLWTTLRYYGIDRIADAITHDCAMATHLGEQVTASDDLELLAPVELGICCFRYLPSTTSSVDIDLDTLNQRVLAALVDSGEAYLSNATVHDQFALRACVVNFRTTRQDIEHMLTSVRALGAQLTSQ
ncbi:MAG: pyridoxal-dependent decarboxylase [Jatrophihabitantaceae bacterium]